MKYMKKLTRFALTFEMMYLAAGVIAGAIYCLVVIPELIAKGNFQDAFVLGGQMLLSLAVVGLILWFIRNAQKTVESLRNSQSQIDDADETSL